MVKNIENKVRITLIIPCLNVVEYIAQCIESAINQTINNYEIIVVDAGSTDGTIEVINKYINSCDREDLSIRLLNSGIKSYGYQVNLGIKNANGEFIAILEADDYIALDMYENLYKKASSSELEYIKGEFEELTSDEKGNIISTNSRTLRSCSEKYDCIIKPRDVLDTFIFDYNVWRGIYRKAFLLDNNIWFTETSGASYQDIGFNMQVLCIAERAMYVEKPFYKYRRLRPDSSINSNKGLEFIYYEFNNLIKNHKNICGKGFYLRLLASFWDEYAVYIYRNNGMPITEKNAIIIQWFKEKIRDILANDIVTRTDCYFLDFDAVERFVNE